MGKKLTRRKVLERGLKGSLIVLGGAARLVPGSVEAIWARALEAQSEGSASKVLSTLERANLEAAADGIIPATDPMPAASEVGAVGYIEVVLGDVGELREQIQTALTRLEQSSQSGHSRSFSKLGADERVKLLEAFEKESTEEGKSGGLFQSGSQPNLFVILRDLVYEAYYTSPEVWPKIGYEFHGTDAPGPDMKPFDESILENVRKKPKFYREVD